MMTEKQQAGFRCSGRLSLRMMQLFFLTFFLRCCTFQPHLNFLVQGKHFMGEVCSFKAKYVCSNARLEAMCYEPCWCLMHSISTWFASALVPPSHMRARPTSSSQNQSLLHFFLHHRILPSQNGSKRERKTLQAYLLVHFKKPLPILFNYLCFCGLY